MLNLLLYLLGITTNPGYIYEDYCKKDLTGLSLDAKIEMTIGCSEVHGHRTYNDAKLKAIYENR